ncbi:hypothetical protein MK805_16645 [Shimazuella sp. AN120528]|uniref:DUF6557 family protein n=1 Tax=Shimazuella soli TaxID=1892854 RepID=UPI001F117463|nr:DUF6557 family protein [Shimazuella soli]MCH5586569.1 hypothetical protein [Shimazuella soli]
MKIVVGMGIITLLLFLILWFFIRKSKSTGNKEILTLPSFASCLTDVSWDEVEEELIRLHLDKLRNLSQLKQTYEELFYLQPNNSLEKQFVLYLHLNEERKFIDVYAKEKGDLYTEYMIDEDEWKNVLAYEVSKEALDKYSKPTLVCATLFTITAARYSSNKISQRKQAPTA